MFRNILNMEIKHKTDKTSDFMESTFWLGYGVERAENKNLS